MNKNKLIIILVGFLDILSIGIIIPTLPDLAKYYGVSAHLISYGITIYALCSFLSAPILGQLSDVFGRKKILSICVAGSFLSSLLIALVGLYPVFLIGRIINGLTGGNISILQAMISDISKTKEERQVNLGLIGMLFGAGFIIGPLFGAMLLHFGILAPYWFMAILSFVETIVLIVFLKETNEHITPKKIKYNPFGQIFKYLKMPKINLYIYSLLIILISFSFYQGILPLYLNKVYGLSGSSSGYILAGIGVVFFINQAFLLRKFWLKRFSLNTLLYIINIGVFLLFLALWLIKPLPYFLFLFVFLASIQIIVNPVYQGEIIENTEHHSRGEIIGVLSSLQAISMFIGPFLGGIFIDKNISIFMLSTFFVSFSFFIVLKIVNPKKLIAE
ncbi:MAG: MFS transporter [Candidatus Gracilibacteria bacterium]|nr:MFS transporter [Candidatus Gracilibacteria bacterium]